jgi:hypothetical protein
MHNAPMSLEQLIAALKSGAADGLANGPRGAAGNEPPPVESWNPAHCTDDGNMEILRDGVWRHEGARITRPAMVALFASILRKDADGETYLVTPVEKVRVRVEDAPFLAVRADRHGEGRDQTIIFTTNVGDVVVADADRPIRVVIDPETQEPRPYVLVRGRLEARILRAPFLDLVDWSQAEGEELILWSAGTRFALGSVT